MAQETYIKRMVWVATCPCLSGTEKEPFSKVYTENPPRETRCPHCHEWIVPKSESYIGPEINPNP